MKLQKLSVSQIDLEILPPTITGELFDVFIRYCSFCRKKCHSNDLNREICEKMSGGNGYYCAFCLRNGFHTKNCKDILILSFRAIIAWLYYYKYLSNTSEKMWLSEIEDCIESHRQTGLTNPAFLYDPDTYLWFINFAQIGGGKKHQTIDDVYRTIVNILVCFNLKNNVHGIDTAEFFQKYRKSIEEFFQKRQRPKNRYMLIPTFTNCGTLHIPDRISSTKLRNFDSQSFDCKKFT